MGKDRVEAKKIVHAAQPGEKGGGVPDSFTSSAGLDDWDRRIAKLLDIQPSLLELPFVQIHKANGTTSA